MHGEAQSRSLIFCRRLYLTNAVLAIAIVFALTTISVQSARAQTFTVLHSLNGLQDGYYPIAGVTVAPNGDLYGTTQYSGLSGGDCYEGCGTVFRLAHKGSGWIFTTLYSFTGGNDGGNSYGRVIFGPDGSLYGTTSEGGGGSCEEGCGTVFNLKPPPHATANVLGGWTETVLYRFTGGADGATPVGADLIFDRGGNLYGTTDGGGPGNCQGGCGTVYKLAPSNGNWTESVLHGFTTQDGDGQRPWGGVIFDQSGNLYGTTQNGPFGSFGTIYKLIPAGLTWTERILYTFQGTSDGEYPYSGLIFDPAGNLYGTTCCGGPDGVGTAYEFTPSGGTFSVLYSNFGGYGGPDGNLVMDAAGNLYGTTQSGGAYHFGSVFKLTPGSGGWTYTSLHDFCAGGYPCSDGALAHGGVAFDAEGNLYGTTAEGGTSYSGVIWKISP
jgi:uncharacterized repeat protein (TIGR03803 family)